ncbi:MAG: acyl-CoA dehydrogenase [Clostridiaceae bacterium BRH_c20a]|nr:MAG: acyl-CoA dehydrogenase [Clostridiaceae bacterium BRH_c20a]
MNFELSEEQLMIQKMARRFAEEKIAPIAEKSWEEEEFPYDLFAQMGELGLVGIPYPEEYNGGGMDVLTFALVLEELARIDNSVANSIMANSSCASLINNFGTTEHKEKYLAPILAGEKIGAIGLTEPNAGSDAAAIQTTAVLNGDEWIINGSKIFITNSGTDITWPVVIAAVTGTGEKKEISNFIVSSGTPGFNISKKFKKIGWRASDTRELSFDDCRIPAENLLGKRGEGLKQTLSTINTGRILIASMAVGLAQGVLDACLDYVKGRFAFGKPIGKFQTIQHKLADMATKTEIARVMVHKAAVLRDSGKPFSKEASMAKLFATEMAMEAAHQGIQIHGGYGIMTEYAVSRYFGDAKVLEIVEGTSEIQRTVIARQLGL